LVVKKKGCTFVALFESKNEKEIFQPKGKTFKKDKKKFGSKEKRLYFCSRF